MSHSHGRDPRTGGCWQGPPPKLVQGGVSAFPALRRLRANATVMHNTRTLTQAALPPAWHPLPPFHAYPQVCSAGPTALLLLFPLCFLKIFLSFLQAGLGFNCRIFGCSL